MLRWERTWGNEGRKKLTGTSYTFGDVNREPAGGHRALGKARRRERSVKEIGKNEKILRRRCHVPTTKIVLK